MPDPALDIGDVPAAVRRGALTLAVDPDVQHFSPETVALVFLRSCLALVGAGSLEVVAERLADDPDLADMPGSVLDALVGPCVRHFAKAFDAEQKEVPDA